MPSASAMGVALQGIYFQMLCGRFGFFSFPLLFDFYFLCSLYELLITCIIVKYACTTVTIVGADRLQGAGGAINTHTYRQTGYGHLPDELFEFVSNLKRFMLIEIRIFFGSIVRTKS